MTVSHGSDDTIKIAGKRVGPAEVEAIACTVDGILECAAIGVPDAIKGESLVVFCVLRDPELKVETLRATVTQLIGEGLGKPLRPSGVFFVDSLPKTRNAKVMRRLVRAAHLGLDLGNTTALESEDSIAHVRAAR